MRLVVVGRRFRCRRTAAFVVRATGVFVTLTPMLHLAVLGAIRYVSTARTLGQLVAQVSFEDKTVGAHLHISGSGIHIRLVSFSLFLMHLAGEILNFSVLWCGSKEVLHVIKAG